MMDCKDYESYLSDYLEDDLDKERTDAMLDHIERCETCRTEFAAYQKQEGRLQRYFQSEFETVAEMPNPVPETVPAVPPNVWLRYLKWAVAATLLIVVGGGGWSAYRNTVPSGRAELARAQEVDGLVLVLEGDTFVPLAADAAVRQNQRIKVAGGGYLALELPGGNVLEARGSTQLALLDFPGRFEVEMDRGHVWAHLNNPPPKPFVVRTAHLAARAVGTVYGVEEGLDRSAVMVAEGTVEVDNGGSVASVEAGETYVSNGEPTDIAIAESILWSRLQEDLVAFADALSGGTTSNQPLLQTEGTSVADAATTVGPEADMTVAYLDLLPTDTLHLLHIDDWSDLIEEFNVSAYSDVVEMPLIRDWWERVGGARLQQEMVEETGLHHLLDIAGMIEGELAVGLTTTHQLLVLADCGENAAQVEARLEALRVEAGMPPSDELERSVYFAGGLLIFSSDPNLALGTLQRAYRNDPTGFAGGAFYRKIQADVVDPRLILASDLGGQIEYVTHEMFDRDQDADVREMFDLIGLPSLDYLLLSPSFAGRGMNQAARLAFVDEGRYGAMNWLAEPAPMRGLDFFGPDIPFFAAAVVRSPYEMFIDYLLYCQKTTSDDNFQEMLQLAAGKVDLFRSIGGEIAIGVDRPVLPVPNVKIVLELFDRPTFAMGLQELVTEIQNALSTNGQLTVIETVEHKGYTIQTLVIDGVPFVQPSWTFVDDYFVAGPGPQYVRDSIDVRESGHSIANDSERLLPLLPGGNDMHFSLLVYQDIAQSVPAILSETLTKHLDDEGRELVPDLSFMESCRAPSIAYAYARERCIDLYFNAPGGIDFNFGFAMPMVANWLLPRTSIGQTVSRVAEAELGLDAMAEAAKRFQAEKGRLPHSLGELAGAIDTIPLDPFGALHGDALRLTEGPAPGEITLYSIGPDGEDNRGLIVFDISDKYDGPGDIVRRLPEAAD